MKIKHRISGSWERKHTKILSKYGFEVNGFDTLDIEENETYFELKPYFEKWSVLDIRYPEFTNKEVKDSILSVKNGSHLNGYPMPDNDNGYLDLTYDLSNYCSCCGTGLKQKDSFRIKSEPKLGKKRIYQLTWINDELFVEKELYNDIFKPLGIRYKDVLLYKKETILENTVQLVIPEATEDLNLKGYPTEKCDICNVLKYSPMPIGFYPTYEDESLQIFKTKEYFGSGASAFKKIYIAQELREKLIDLKIEKRPWYIPAK